MFKMEIGSLYEKTRNELIEEINNLDNFNFWINERIATGHVCYFCTKKIIDGERMFELVRSFYYSEGVDRERFYCDVSCMDELVRDK